jgi:hypothetical protein
MGMKCYSMHRGCTHTDHPKTIKKKLYAYQEVNATHQEKAYEWNRAKPLFCDALWQQIFFPRSMG